ncbi:DNA replication/repair protein RecF [Oerskovia turbata]|uniref:DNA replication and repair protein RecF n=1 Tax=Oerskovia turbata TaxID=1713 RepID=A0A4Q1KKW1_9CELL|nr:DNA replication/repair protein RecF [Oerskovia turbata]RXR21743.1 DNA replication/repair protein RecF [Oerskovia turbata]RXR29344.1 DNA replication/repair protein RecF [Oerskovia turbata]TGJ95937.1 DNA replication/repair protein RecF [Actinotalea fermentans ATCC 43279 = JCM 9966 = DSM 3133]
MYISHLSLADFRSYTSVDVELEPGVNAFVGPNGQGKTNLVEAIGYVATLGSHRVPSDAALVRAGASRAVVRARIVRGDRASTVEIEIAAGKANRARINRAPAGKPRDVLGIARTVLFAPEDLALVKGDPDGRRRFLDQLAVLLMPRFAGVLADYDRVLRQRSALLKSAGGAMRASRSSTPDLRTLDVWDAKLAATGAEIVALRLQLVAALQPYAAAAYEQVSSGQGEAHIAYRSSVAAALEDGRDAVGQGGGPQTVEALETQLLEAMASLRSKEIERGVCLVGPHRDDLVLTLGGLPAKGYASHGESWSFALALRLASYRLLTDGAPETAGSLLWSPDWGPDGEPVLLLDDVFAELDVRRRDRLADLVAGANQVIITAAVPEDVPQQLSGLRLDVLDGRVTRRA